jgi:hypothetical protein
MQKKANIKEECPFELEANAEICPLQIPTYLPPEVSEERLRNFFTSFIERDLWELTYVQVGQIVRLLEEPMVQNGNFDEKCNAVTDLFVQGLFEKRAEMLTPDA